MVTASSWDTWVTSQWLILNTLSPAFSIPCLWGRRGSSCSIHVSVNVGKNKCWERTCMYMYMHLLKVVPNEYNQFCHVFFAPLHTHVHYIVRTCVPSQVNTCSPPECHWSDGNMRHSDGPAFITASCIVWNSNMATWHYSVSNIALVDQYHWLCTITVYTNGEWSTLKAPIVSPYIHTHSHVQCAKIGHCLYTCTCTRKTSIDNLTECNILTKTSIVFPYILIHTLTIH